MLITGVIYVRGEGSTLRRKNTRRICGKPMLYWSLQNAIEAGFIEELFIFTDDEEAKEIATGLGCNIINRPKEMIFYNGGFSNPSTWWPYVESKIQEALGSIGDITVSLNCNVCLLKGETMRQMYIRLMEDELASVIFPVVDVEPHLYMENPVTGYLFPIWEDPGLDRQKYPKLFRRVGVNIGHRKRSQICAHPKTLHHLIPFEESIDVHSLEDITLAEAFLSKRLADNHLDQIERYAV